MGEPLNTSPASSWQDIAARKQLARQNKIPQAWRIDVDKYANQLNVIGVPETCGILSAGEIDITSNHDAVDVATKIRDNVWSVEEVVTAFCKRAAIAQQLVNCLTEIFFDEAIETAKQMDARRRENPNAPLPPLFGVPISLKDGFKIPGHDATVGFVAWAEQPATEYSALPALLKDLGAVFYCKTNIPQTLMTADSENNLFGRTLNPRNKLLTAGGSSGGEGALVALRGSVLGVGTDVAGSIRIPSLCCGTYGFKTTASIVPYAGQASATTPGRPGIIACAGPIANSARSCELFLRSVIEAKPWRYDASCLNLPWLPTLPVPAKMRIGLIEDDGMFTPSPPVRRTLHEAADRLRSAGHDIVPVQLPSLANYVTDIWEHFSLDGSKRAVETIAASGEPLVPSVARGGLTSKPPKTLLEFMALNARRSEAKTTYAQLWNEHNLDVILMPPCAYTAPPLDSWSVVTYTALFNYLDWPEVILPVGKVSAADLIDDAAQYGEQDKAVYSLYTGPEGSIEAPTTIALVGRPQEDQLLAVQAVAIDGILRST